MANGRGHAWQEACMAGGVHGRGHVWQEGMYGRGEGVCMVGCAWQGDMCAMGCVWQGMHDRGHVWGCAW